MLLRDDLLDFPGLHGSPSRCRVRLFLPAAGNVGMASYVVLLTDDAHAHGTGITNAAEVLAALACRRYHLPPERTMFIEHYDYRHHRPGGVDICRRAESFDRVFFSRATAAALLGGDLSPSFGQPSWKHRNKAAVEELVGESLP